MNLKSVFENVHKAFTIRRDVDFDDMGIHITLETPSSEDEVKVLEACQNFDGAAYIEQLKRHSLATAIRRINDIDLTDKEVTVNDEEAGTKETMSRYLFLVQQIGEWPSSLRDVLFEVLTNMQAELDQRVNEKIKYEHFTVSEVTEEKESESEFKRVDAPDEDPDMTDVERQSAQAMREVEEADIQMSMTAAAADQPQG